LRTMIGHDLVRGGARSGVIPQRPIL
jgi:hypothetical protein